MRLEGIALFGKGWLVDGSSSGNPKRAISAPKSPDRMAAVGVAVVLRPGERVSADELREHCAPLIARHKIPRYIWILDQPLPRNANGKFLKRELRETLKTEAAV